MANYKWRQIRTDKAPSTSGWKTSYMQSNGILCWYIMRDSWGLSLNQSCGVLGNMQAEGYLNPAQWQIGSNYDASAGYGMFQFTPSTKYTNTVTSAVLGNAKKNGKAQLQWVLDNPGQWSSGHSMDGLKALTSIHDAADYWCLYWERPASPNLDTRRAYADTWYTVITGHTPPTPGGDIPIGGILKTLRDRFAFY